MGRQWEGLKYIVMHKYYVYQYCMQLNVSLWQAIIHDWTKILPWEWFPYVNFFYNSDGTRRDIDKIKQEEWFRKIKKSFMKSWERHTHFHKHHWQAWLDENKIPSEMPEKYLREMVADWFGASKTLDHSVKEWYEKTKEKMILHPKSKEFAEKLMKSLKDTI